MKVSEVDLMLGYQRSQSHHKVEGLEGDMGSIVAKRRLQLRTLPVGVSDRRCSETAGRTM